MKKHIVDMFSLPNLCKNKNMKDVVVEPANSEYQSTIIDAQQSASISNDYENNEESAIKHNIEDCKIENLPIMDLTGKEEKQRNLSSSGEDLSKQIDSEYPILILKHEEHQYLDLIRDIINNGYYEQGRNGNTFTKFGHSMRFSLRNGTIPILTTKKVAWRVCFEELFWFIRGSTSNHELIDKNVHIWDANASREFLDSRGLYSLEENDLGPIYGFQWRHFNADYTNCNDYYHGEGVDQLKEIIDNLKNPATRSSRRLIMSAWNPCQINSMALPPCHVMAQFHVREGRYLSCALFQRSGDVGLGVPFNIASYALFTHILARHCDLEADEFVHFLGNCHIYEGHIEPLKTQLLREPKEFPKIRIANKYENIEEYSLEDILWETKYDSWGTIKMDMIA